MNLSLGKNRVLSVHKLVKQHPQGVGIKGRIRRIRFSLIPGMIEIRDILSLPETVHDRVIQGDGFANFGHTALYIYIPYMETHIQTPDTRVLNGLKGLKQGIKEELNLLIPELDPTCPKPLHIPLQRPFIGIGRYDVDETFLLDYLDHFGEGVLCLVQLEDCGVDVSGLVGFYAQEAVGAAYGQVDGLLEVFVWVFGLAQEQVGRGESPF